MKKDKVLPQIQLKYLHKGKDGRLSGEMFVCDFCGAETDQFGGFYQPRFGRKKLKCEACAIDNFMKTEGYTSREAAAARRRRLFDVTYLLVEMLIDDEMNKTSIKDFDDIPESVFNAIFEESIDIWDTIPKETKIRLEETEDQKEIEKFLREYLKEYFS